MRLEEYFELMRFPPEWVAWGMFPAEHAQEQMALYEPGHEHGSEHDRHGCFQWWLRQDLSAEKLVTLARLSWLDPDEPMGGYVRECIAKHADYTPQIEQALRVRYERA